MYSSFTTQYQVDPGQVSVSSPPRAHTLHLPGTNSHLLETEGAFSQQSTAQTFSFTPIQTPSEGPQPQTGVTDGRADASAALYLRRFPRINSAAFIHEVPLNELPADHGSIR